MHTREKYINVEIPRGIGENRCRRFEKGTGENCDNFIDRMNDKSLQEAFQKGSRPAMKGIFASHLPKNGNGLRFIHGPQLENIQSIHIQPRIIQYPKQQEITAIALNPPAIVPHLLPTHRMKSGPPHESFKRPSMLLNKYPDFQYAESLKVLTLPTRLSSTLSTGSMIHYTNLPWMGLPIHHPPMGTGNQRYFHSLSSCPMPLRTTSIASFVKDEYNHWWFIHYETIL
uniref:Uncharacterized protein n=1 Tax=Lygus hesperus TaxID=30085 RepID=A0A0K8S8L6_LYGHE